MTGPITAQVVVRGDCGELSPNRRLHFRTRATRVKRWRDAAAWAAKELGWKKTARKVRLSWVIRHWRKSDHAQLHGTLSLKAMEDGLVDAGIVPDDNEDYVVWGDVRQETGGQFRFREEVVVTIEVLEESNGTERAGCRPRGRNPQAKGRKGPRGDANGDRDKPDAGAGRKRAAPRRKPGSRKAQGGP